MGMGVDIRWTHPIGPLRLHLHLTLRDLIVRGVVGAKVPEGQRYGDGSRAMERTSALCCTSDMFYLF